MNLLQPSTWFKTPEQKELSFDEVLRLLSNASTVASGESVTPSNATRQTTVRSIVRALSQAMATYPVGVFQRTLNDDGKETLSPLPNHQLNRLLRVPNNAMTWDMYIRRVSSNVALWGNFVAIKLQGQTGPIRQLQPVHPDQVELLEDDPLNPQYRISFAGGEQRMFTARQVHHIAGGLQIESLWSRSPVNDCREAIGLALAAERLLSQLYGNGSIPTFLLTGGKFNSEEQYKAWVRQFSEVYGRSGTRGGVAMLPEGMDAKELTFKPMDAQLLEARKFQRTEIAAVWGVPPHKIADLERATFANIEHQSLEFISDATLPVVKAVEQAMERDLLTLEDRQRGVVVRFDLDQAMLVDFESRVSGYKDLHEVGAINPNEIRGRERMNPRTDPAGDDYATPLNMRTTGDDDNSSTDSGTEGSSDQSSTSGVRAVQ